jgi:predicted O-methyltransferase YrrM
MPKLLKQLSFKLFLLGDRFGIHVLPKHFYTPVPDYRWLKEHPESWMPRTDLVGVHWDLDEQMGWLKQICGPYYDEVAGLDFFERASHSEFGPGFGDIESQVLHCFVRTTAPPHVLEIGSGVSTACMLHAIELNRKDGKAASEVTCIEPYPRKSFHELNVHHIKETCQTVPNSVFDQLSAGDLLFIDSSHSVKVGSDVIRIYLEILPRLRAGVFVHIHDIFLPYLYQRSLMKEYFASQETALLLALLTENKRLGILACLSGLHYDRTEEMRKLLPDYRPREGVEGLDRGANPSGHCPNSLWLKTV